MRQKINSLGASDSKPTHQLLPTKPMRSIQKQGCKSVQVPLIYVTCRAVFAVLIIITPLSLLIMLFPCLVIVRSMLCLFGSVKRVEENSVTFSGREPSPWQGPLPRVTVQMPVFMEDLDFVIRPSVK